MDPWHAPQFIRNSGKKWLNAGDNKKFASRYSVLRPFLGRTAPILSFDEERQLFSVSDEDHQIFVARRSRLHYQLRGLKRRRDTLAAEYLLSDALLRPGDLVVDCGANIGEFTVLCAERGARVLAFEPDPQEFKALRANTERWSKTQVFQKALWKKTETLTFYDSNDTGDSSIFEPPSFAEKITIEALAFNDFEGLPSSSDRIRLVKLEAEGAEPEILQGMDELIESVDFITADLGPERGMKQENTVAEVTDLLYTRGFRMISFFPLRYIALFKNQQIPS